MMGLRELRFITPLLLDVGQVIIRTEPAGDPFDKVVVKKIFCQYLNHGITLVTYVEFLDMVGGEHVGILRNEYPHIEIYI